MLKETQTRPLIAQLFDNQPDSVVWFAPVFEHENSDKVIDFESRYANHAAARILKVNRDQVKGRLLNNNLMDKTSSKLVFDQCLQVWNSNEPIEYNYFNSGFDSYYNVQRSKVEGGILSITRDRTKEVLIEQALKKQEEKYLNILENSTDGIIVLKPIRVEAGAIKDFQLFYCNRYAIEEGKLPAQYEGKTLLEVLPYFKNSDQFERHRRVAETGIPERYENSFRTLNGEEFGWFMVSLSRADDDVVSRFVNITERKHFEETIALQTKKLDQIINSSLNAICTLEAIRDNNSTITDMKYTNINDMYTRMMHTTRENIIGNTILNVHPGIVHTDVFTKYCNVIQTGIPDRFQIHYERDGLDAWYDISCVRVEENNVVITFADITEIKNTILEIERHKIMLDNILTYSPSGITIIKAIRNEKGNVIDFQHTLVNDQAEKFIGYSRELLLTHSNSQLDPGFAESNLLKELAYTLETGKTSFTDYRIPTGQWIEGAASKMDSDHLICVINDVTIFKESQQKMTELIKELQRSNKNLEEFAHAASHDLKEPIRKVNYFSQRLRQKLHEKLDQDDNSLFDRLERATERMGLLIDDLLEFSHVSMQMPDKETVDLNEKVRNVLADLEVPIKEKKAVIHSHQLPVIKGYRRQLQQLFQNLISNAIKYSQPDSLPEITIVANEVKTEEMSELGTTTDPSKKYYRIEITDNGIGFEQEDAHKIFNIFTRLHGNQFSGTGVGLSIVRKVVENHHGDIKVKSKPNEGTTFTVILPAE